MAETNANIRIGVDTSDALAQLKNLQAQISTFHTRMAASGKAAAEQSARMQSSLMKSINSTGAFTAQMTTVRTATESFTHALEKNKLTIGQSFRYAAASTRTFGRFFRNELNTVNRVASERVKDLQTQYIKMGRDAGGAMKAIAVRPATLDMKNLGTQTAMAAQRFQLFNQLVKQGSTNLLNWGKNTQWAGRQLMVGFTVPLTIFGGIAIREFQKIEEQAIKFRRVYGDMFTSTKETERALSDVRRLADEFTRYGIAVEQTIDLAAKVAQMGNVGPALEAQVREATRLSILGGMEQQEALDTTIGLTNAFGIEIEKLTEKVNFLNAAENQTILAIQDFNTAVPLAGSVVNELGGSVEDLAFFLTAMREGGINASQGANALKSSLGRLINPSKAAVDSLGQMGINIRAIVDQNAGDLRQTVMTLAYALEELDPLERARAIDQLFGRFQFARMSTLFSNIVDEGSQANKVLELTTNSAEELAILADRELGRVEESAATRFQKSVQQLQAALAPIGEAFLEVVTPILRAITTLVEKFGGMGDVGRKILVGVIALLGAVAPAVLMIVGLVANGIANLMKFGQLIINLFAKTGNSSNVLTEQLNYMNSEQIEAYAVSAALDQVHNRLVQTFNAETKSIDLLTAAYGRAIDRQRQMMMGRVVGTPGAGPSKAGGTGGRVPGYADGIVSVPGPKGAGDIMPAMLSPGEAVIPTQQAQKYSALIQGIIRDDIPGFSQGTPQDGPRIRWNKPDFATQEMHVQSQVPATPQVLAELEKLIPGISKLSSEMLDLIVIVGDLTATKSKELNQEAKGAGFTNEEAVRGASFEERRDHSQSRFTEEWDRNKGEGFTNVASRAKAAGQLEDTPEVDASVQKLDEAVGERVAARIATVGADEMSEPGWLDRLIAEVTDEVVADMQRSKDRADQQVAKAMKERKATPTGVRTDGIQKRVTDPETGAPTTSQARAFEVLEQRGMATQSDTHSGLVAVGEDGAPTQVRLSRLDRGRQRSTSMGRGLIESQVAGGTYEDVTRTVGTRSVASPAIGPVEDVFEGEDATFVGKEIATKLREDAISGMEETAETNSESKRARKVGEDTVDGYINALEEGVPKAKEVGEKQADAAAEKSKKKKTTSPADDPRNQARKQDFDASKKDMIKRQKMKDYGTEGDISAEMRWRRKAAQARERQLQREMKALQQEQVLTTQKQRVTNAQQNEVKKQGIVARLQERMLARKQQRLAREGKLATQETAMDSARMARSGGVMGRGIRMGGAGMLASTGMMMASQAPGAVGETAQRLVGPMMSLSLILPLLTSKIGILIAVVGAIVGTFMFFSNSINRAAKESMELTKALGAGSDAIQSFAKAAGKVTAGEILDRRAATEGQTFQLQAGETSFGEAFIQSDDGEALLASLSKAAESGDMQRIQQQVISQMSTAVAAGALSAGQARSIVEQLAKEMGDYRFGIEVNSRLIDLLGPDGENLLEDPLGIRVRLITETGDAISIMSEGFGSALDDAGKDAGKSFATNFAVSAAAGAGAAFAASKMSGNIDKVLERTAVRLGGRFAARMGVAMGTGAMAAGVGAIAGAVVGLGLTAFDVAKAFKEIGTAAGGVVATSIIALQQQKEMLASLQIEYEGRINNALAANDLTEAMRLQNEFLEHRQTLLEASSEVMRQISDSYNEAGFMGQRAMDKSLDDLLAQMKKDDVLQQQLINSATQSLKSATGGLFSDGISSDTAYQIKLMIASEDLSPAEVNSLLQAEPKTIERFVNVATNLGVAEGNRALQVMNLFDDPQQKAQFLINVDTQEDANAQRYIDVFQEISRVGNVANLDMLMGFYLENPEEAEMLFNDINEIRQIGAEGPLEIDAYLHLFDDPEAQEALLAFADEFANLPEEDQVTYIQTFRTIFQTEGTPQFQQELDMFRQTTGRRSATGADMASASASRLVGARQARGGAGADEPMDEPSGGGSKREQKTQASALDDLVRRLRNVQQNQINVTTGFKDSANMINKLFGSGKSGSMFSGIEQDMRKLGAGQDLISLIAGMDPEVFERRKHELFTFDGAGNIKGFTNTLVNLGKAMRQIALGEFQSQQQSSIQTTTDQVIAMRKLVGAGLTATEAYNAVQDAAVASAIAHEKNSGTLRELANATKEATKLTQAFAAAQAVAAKNQETANLRDTLSFAQANFGSMTEAQKDLVMSDVNIQALIQANVDNDTLMQALKDAEERASLEIEIKKLTFAGRLEIFEEGFNKAMEKFQVLETEIRLDFKDKKDPFLEIIKQAERDIADIRNRAGGLGDLEAELQRITWQEEKINKRYDARLEALSVIEKINSRINQQQRSALDVADALSRGDIAAAARAVQESRQKAAEASQQDKRDQIEASRRRDLEKVVGRGGLNREKIEERIRSLQIEIFNIEQNRVRPAQRTVELLERQEEAAVEGLKVLGKTRDEWERVNNNVQKAKVSTDEYTQAIQEALDIVEDILEYWNQIEDQKAQLIIEEVFIPDTREEVEGVAGPAIADDPVEGDGGGGGASRSTATTGGGGRPALGDEADFVGGDIVPEPEEDGESWWSKFWGAFDLRGWIQKFISQPWVQSLAAIAVGTFNVFIKPILDFINDKLIQPAIAFFQAAWQKITELWDTYVVQPIIKLADWINEKVIQPTIEWFKSAWEKISELWNTYVVEPITAIASWIDEKVIQPIVEGFQRFFGWFMSDKSFEEKVQDVEDFWNNSIERVVGFLAGIVEWFKELPGKIWSFITEDIPRMMDQAVDAAVIGLAKIVNWFVALPGKIRSFVTEDIPAMWNTLVEKVTLVSESIVNWFRELPGKVWMFITEDIPAFFVDMTNKVSTFLEPIVTWFMNLPGKIWMFITETIPNFFVNMTNKVATFLEPIVTWFMDLPGKIWDFITVTIPESFGNLAESAANFLAPIFEWFVNLPETIRSYIEEKIALFFDNLSPEARAFLEPIFTWFAELPDRIKNFFTVTIPEYFRQSRDLMLERIQAVFEWFRNLPGRIRNFITNTIPNFFNQLRTAALNRIAGIFDWFRNLPNRIRSFITSTIPNLFRTLATTGLSHLGRIFNWFRDLPGHVRGWFGNIGNIIRTSVTGAINGAIRAMRGFRLSMPRTVLGIPLPRGIAGASFSPFSGLRELSFNQGGLVPGLGNTDTVPAMLTPGEFVINKDSVKQYGLELMKMLNEGSLKVNSLSQPSFDLPDMSGVGVSNSTTPGSSVYNNTYSISVNVKSEANPDQIARTVINQIRTVDSQRIRGSRL